MEAPIAPESTCFALWGADLLLDTHAEIQLCEVNSHPALGWGTMSKVPSHFFSELVQDILSILLYGHDEHKSHFRPLTVQSNLKQEQHF